MERQSSFDLEEKISNWKQNMLVIAGLSEDNIMELESHLYDEIEILKDKDLDDEEAYIIACKRIGRIDVIATEYRKVDPHRLTIQKMFPYVHGILIFFAFTLFTEMLVYVSTIITTQFFSLTDNIVWVAGTIMLLSIEGLVWLVYHRYTSGKELTDRLIKIPFLVFIVILSSIGIRASMYYLVSFVSPSAHGGMVLGIAIYKISLMLLLIISSLILYKKSKEKVKISYAN